MTSTSDCVRAAQENRQTWDFLDGCECGLEWAETQAPANSLQALMRHAQQYDLAELGVGESHLSVAEQLLAIIEPNSGGRVKNDVIAIWQRMSGHDDCDQLSARFCRGFAVGACLYWSNVKDKS